jgi:sterol desaturase/sphingolipid hydroxylase (fatty acid hydroxylase superfamily)
MDAEILNSIWEGMKEAAVWLLGLGLLFTALSLFTPCNRGQPLWRKDMPTDLCYYFLMPVATRFVRVLFMMAGISIIYSGLSGHEINHYLQHGYGPLAELPVWLQAAIIVLVSDIILYWTHRFFHGQSMWRYHAIHHSPPQVDWLSTYRFHPINTWLTFTLLDALLLLVGFSPSAMLAMTAFNMVYSAMVHANLNWTFGKFRYLFASPVFHRWHHTAQSEGMDKNFAPTFPLLDIVFGTFYMPEGRVPEQYGVPNANIPSGFLGQLIWPFKRK